MVSASGLQKYCRHYFVVGNLARDYSRGSCLISSSTWWKNSLHEHVIVYHVTKSTSNYDDSRPPSPSLWTNTPFFVGVAPPMDYVVLSLEKATPNVVCATSLKAPTTLILEINYLN